MTQQTQASRDAYNWARFFRVSGTARPLNIPGYDLCTLLFGVLAVAQILGALTDKQTASAWQIVGLSLSILLTLICSYKAHTANGGSDTIQS